MTDAIAAEITAGRPVSGFRFEGTRYDCGSKIGFLEATVTFTLARPDLGECFGASLARMQAQAIAAE